MSSTDLTKREPLTPQQFVAARLLARGLPKGDVAALVGVHAKTVQSWRNELPAFMDQLEAETIAYVENQEPVIARFRSEVLHGLSVGIAKLIELTEAEYESIPIADIQHKAAKDLSVAGIALLRIQGEKSAELTTPGGATVVIEFVNAPTDVIEDADFEEVDDGQGQGTGADDDQPDADRGDDTGTGGVAD